MAADAAAPPRAISATTARPTASVARRARLMQPEYHTLRRFAVSEAESERLANAGALPLVAVEDEERVRGAVEGDELGEVPAPRRADAGLERLLAGLADRRPHLHAAEDELADRRAIQRPGV